jgi:DNA-binding NarL/FixJ family response regulator
MATTHSKTTEEPAPGAEAKLPGAASPLRVCMIEDDRRVRETLRDFLNQSGQFTCIRAFADGESALAELPRLNADLVLMDVRLPAMSGIECTRAVKALMPSLPIVMLTAFDEEEFLFDSLKAGANGYLLKRTPGPKLLEALQEACFGGLPLAPFMAAKVGDYFQNLSKPPPGVEGLTQREQQALSFLADGFRYKEIAVRMDVGLDTVRKHVRSIYDKLHVSSRTEAVVKYLRR